MPLRPRFIHTAAMLILALLFVPLARAKATQIHIEYGRVSTPPAPTDYNGRQLWRSGRDFLRIQYPQETNGNAITKIANGLDLYTISTRPPRVKHTTTAYPDAKPHAYILARGGPEALMTLEIGNELDYFREHRATRGPDEMIRGIPCASYTLDIEPYHLTLYIHRFTATPRELRVKGPRKGFAIQYKFYERGLPFEAARFRPPEFGESNNSESSNGDPGEGARPSKTVPKKDYVAGPPHDGSPPHAPRIISIPWSLKATREATQSLDIGDTLRFTDPDGSVSFVWQATAKSLRALRSLNANHYQGAYAPTLAAAEDGDARAQYNLTVISDAGIGSREESYQWMLKSRDQGYVFAIWGLGVSLEGGKGVTTDPKAALELYKEAAKHGLVEAELSLGLAYLKKDKPDEKLGLEWIQRAADRGHAPATAALKEFQKAKEKEKVQGRQLLSSMNLLKHAAAQGDAHAETALGTIYARSLGVPQDMKKAAEWYQKAADHGETGAMILLGLMFLEGNGVNRDQSKGLRYIQSAGDQGYSPAAAVLSSIYHLGHGVSKDEGLSHVHFKRASELCSPDEMLSAGLMILQGDGVPRDKETGIKLISFPANKGYIPAQYMLGRHYWIVQEGDVRASRAKALQWFLKAAKQGFADSQRSAAQLYRGVPGVEMDWAKGKYWLQQAVSQGSEAAEEEQIAMKADLVKMISGFRTRMPNALRGNKHHQDVVIHECSMRFDVPIQAEAAAVFEAGPDSARMNPQLADCVRRVEAQAAALKD